MLESCILDETTYTNPDTYQQYLGKVILDARDAIVIIPRQPLTPGATYRVSITVNGQTHSWSFSVSSTADIFQNILWQDTFPVNFGHR